MRSKSRFPRGLVLVAALATGLGLTPNILAQEPTDETVETVFPIVANPLRSSLEDSSTSGQIAGASTVGPERERDNL